MDQEIVAVEVTADEEPKKQMIVDAANDYLGKPVFIAFTEEILKIRRNMLIIAIIAIAVAKSGAELSNTISPLGVTLTNVTTENMQIGILAILAYHIIHFAWVGWDSVLEWRIRLTGSFGKNPNRNHGREEDEYPEDPRQASLYNWWQERMRGAHNLEASLAHIYDKLDDFKQQGIVLLTHQSMKDTSFSTQMTEFKLLLNETQINEGKIRVVLESERIEASLARFDNWFSEVHWRQILRFFAFDYFGAIIFASVAFYLLFTVDTASMGDAFSSLSPYISGK